MAPACDDDVLGTVELTSYEADRGARPTVVYRTRRRCWACGGSGEADAGPCGLCAGTGETELERIAVLSVPAGVEDGHHVPIAGENGACVLVRVRPRPRDSTLLRAAAAVGLVAALGFLAFLFLS